jgi:hypothetical protein
MNGSIHQQQAPAADEVEISLFGPGFGECVVVHLGHGDWMIVDSCIELGSNTPAALAYLKRLGVDPASAVRLVLATHWHDDHVRGLAEVVMASKRAVFAITGAVQAQDFQMLLAPWLANQTAINGKGLGEVAKLIAISKERQRAPIPAAENKILWERQSGSPVQVRALSPSDPAVTACIARLGEFAPGAFSRRMPKIEENHASVVVSIRVGSRRMLLGGDLECRHDRKFGWLAIVDAHKESELPKHHFFKIPHHGSPNGHHEEIWSELLYPHPYSSLTPVKTGKTKLPTTGDRNRILSYTDHAYLTALPKAGKFRYPSDKVVEKTMREVARRLGTISYSQGHVCMRGRLDENPSVWSVTQYGSAMHLSQMPDDQT